MTRFQRLLCVLGFWRWKRFRRWVGGRWVERCFLVTSRAYHCRWAFAPQARFDDTTSAIEQWPMKLPRAQARRTT